MKTKFISCLIALGLFGGASFALGDDTKVNSHDKKFVRDYSKIVLKMQRVGQLAQRQSQDPQIRELGQKLIDYYAKAGRMVGATAQTVGVGEKSQISGRDERELNKLATLSGGAFDQAVSHALFQCQEDGVRQLNLEANKGNYLALRQLAVLLQADMEPDLWQTSMLSAQFNGRP
jgi:hypothetical protein